MQLSVKNILMVDDDADDQMLFKEALRELNIEANFLTANNGSDALAKLKEPPPPDVIFLDLNMPIMNGFECLRSLKQENQYRDIPVVIFTTTNDSASIEQSRKLGANAFFHKPIDYSHLLSKLNKILTYIPSLEKGKVAQNEFIV